MHSVYLQISTADPVVHAGLKLIENDIHFIHVNVGERH